MTITKLSQKQVFNMLKVAAYLAASAVISYLITLTTDSPELFGMLNPIVNIGLVAARNFLNDDTAE